MTSERLFNSFIPSETFIPSKQISGYAPDAIQWYTYIGTMMWATSYLTYWFPKQKLTF